MEHDPQPEVYLLHAWIRDIHPMLWRRFLVRSDCTLADLTLSCRSALLGPTSISTASARRTTLCRAFHGLACNDARQIKLADLHFRLNERFS